MCGCFCWAWPRFFCCFAALATKRKSGWGICGSSCFVMMVLLLIDLPFYWCWPTALCTIFLTAYVSFRTVPQCIYGQSRGKKKSNKIGRVEKLCKMLEDIESAGAITAAKASEIHGLLNFAVSFHMGKGTWFQRSCNLQMASDPKKI